MGHATLVSTVVQDKRRRQAGRGPQRAPNGREHGRGQHDAIGIIAQRAGDFGRASAHGDQHNARRDPAHVGHCRADISARVQQQRGHARASVCAACPDNPVSLPIDAAIVANADITVSSREKDQPDARASSRQVQDRSATSDLDDFLGLCGRWRERDGDGEGESGQAHAGNAVERQGRYSFGFGCSVRR